MANRSIGVVTLAILCSLTPFTLIAQVQRDAVPLKSWPAPLYWQPSLAEEQSSRAIRGVSGEPRAVSSTSDITAQATTPIGALVFVAMTPCRLVDTRTGLGFTGAFGPPSLVGGNIRTFPIQSNTTCSIPAVAQAYSFNVTVVPQGATFPGNVNPSGALGYLTIWPTGVSQPNASTLNSFLGTVVANAAIVPAGTGGSVDVFVSNNTDLIIDINGYYAPQTGITLAQGTAAAPSMSFSGDSGTGIYSSGAGSLNIATGGASRLSVAPNGDLSSTGSLSVSGNGFFAGKVGLGTTNPSYKLHLAGNTSFNWPIIKLENIDSGGHAYWLYGGANGVRTDFGIYDETDAAYRFYIQGSTGNVGVGTTTPTSKIEVAAQDGLKVSGFQPFVTLNDTNANKAAFMQGVNGDAVLLTNSRAALIVKDVTGSVGIGTTAPSAGLDVQVTSGYALKATSNGGPGVTGISTNSPGVEGFSTSGSGVSGLSTTNFGVYGQSSSNYAGYFAGSVYVTGTVTQNSDSRLKQGISSLGYGLSEVMRLRPVTWTWKQKPEQGTQLGLIAQDVEEIVPELVSTAKDEDQTKGINYIGLVPVTIKAIQQQQSQIEEQQKRIVEQQEQIEQQRQQIEDLKKLVCLGIAVCK